jgi:hypothetical protein
MVPQLIQKLPAFLYNLKVHHPVHNSLPLLPILSLINPVHTIISHFFKINFNIQGLQESL